MTIEYWITVLGWCGLLNLGLLTIWFLTFVFAHDWIYRLHSRWYTIKREEFDVIHYTMMGNYKLATLFLTIIPYLVLRFSL